MSITVAKLIARSVGRLGQEYSWIRTATGGSTTTFVDSGLIGSYIDDDIKGGTLFILYDAGGAGAAPEGEMVKITDYVDGTGTLTVGTLTVAAAAGDRGVIIVPELPYEVLLEKTNETLRDLGEVVLDSQTLTSDSDVTEYTLPTSLDYRTPVSVRLQTSTTTNDNQWRELTNYKITPAAAGAARKIIFPSPLPDGYTISIYYETLHPGIVLPTGTISGVIPEPLLELTLAIKLMEWYGINTGNQDRVNKLMVDLDEAKRNFKIWKPTRVPRQLNLSGKSEDPGIPDPF